MKPMRRHATKRDLENLWPRSTGHLKQMILIKCSLPIIQHGEMGKERMKEVGDGIGF